MFAWAQVKKSMFGSLLCSFAVLAQDSFALEVEGSPLTEHDLEGESESSVWVETCRDRLDLYLQIFI